MKKFLFAIPFVLLVFLTGCASTNETFRKISDDLGDKAMQAHAFVDIWKIETSDSTANGSPTGKKITIIGDIKSIPLTSRQGEMVKDYAEYRSTETPAWYNSSNVTKETTIIFTGDSAKELKEFSKYLLEQEKLKIQKQEEAAKQVNSTQKTVQGAIKSPLPGK